jgi:hypothetical protein
MLIEWKLPTPLAGIMPQSDPNAAVAAAGAWPVDVAVEGGEADLLDDPQAAEVSASPIMTAAW